MVACALLRPASWHASAPKLLGGEIVLECTISLAASSPGSADGKFERYLVRLFTAGPRVSLRRLVFEHFQIKKSDKERQAALAELHCSFISETVVESAAVKLLSHVNPKMVKNMVLGPDLPG